MNPIDEKQLFEALKCYQGPSINLSIPFFYPERHCAPDPLRLLIAPEGEIITERFVIAIKALGENPSITGIDFSGYTNRNGQLLNNTCWDAFYKMIRQNTRLRRLNLTSSLDGRKEKLWQPFLDIIVTHPSLTELSLRGCFKFCLDEKILWQNFCLALQNNKTITHLNLSDNDLFYLDYTTIKLLMTTLVQMKPGLEHLDVSEWGPTNYKGMASIQIKLELLNDVLKGNKTLTSLSVAANQLGELDAPSAKPFFEAVQSIPNLRQLNLSFNKLGNDEPGIIGRYNPNWPFIYPLLKKKSLKTISLAHNHFGWSLTDKSWEQFCKFIAKTPAAYINLWDNGLHTGAKSGKFFLSSRWKQFCNAIATNPSLKEVDFAVDEFDKLDEKAWHLFCKSVLANNCIQISPAPDRALPEKMKNKKLQSFKDLNGHNRQSYHVVTLNFAYYLLKRPIKNTSPNRLPLPLVRHILGYAIDNPKLLANVNAGIASPRK